MYATYEEDAKFRDKKWNKWFNPEKGARVIMHDCTNIPLDTPEDAELQ